jgi:hypothetical protein
MRKLELQATRINYPEASHRQNEAYEEADRMDPFLRREPIIRKLNQIIICAEVPNMHEYDHGAAESAIRGYNESTHHTATAAT